MLDVKYVLANLDTVIEKLKFRNAHVDFDLLRSLSDERRASCARYDQLKFEQRQASDKMRTISGDEAQTLRAKLKDMSNECKAIDARRTEIDEQLANPETYKDSAKIKDLNCSKTQTAQTLETTIEAWMQAQADLDEAVAAFQN